MRLVVHCPFFSFVRNPRTRSVLPTTGRVRRRIDMVRLNGRAPGAT